MLVHVGNNENTDNVNNERYVTVVSLTVTGCYTRKTLDHREKTAECECYNIHLNLVGVVMGHV